MLKRDDWFNLARKLDWDYSYVDVHDVFPDVISGHPWLSHPDWASWDEPYRTSYSKYVGMQCIKQAALESVKEEAGGIAHFQKLDPAWRSALKLHAATLALAEFAAVVGNLRSARFGRDSGWRTMATFSALDEIRHTELPLRMMHDLVSWDRQFDWTHRFFHTNNWVAIAARHMVDELLIASNPIDFAIGTHFVFETGFTNLQFVGLSSMAHAVGDRMFEKMVKSIQTDEARHAQTGNPVLRIVMEHDPAYAQYLVDKWLWRSWRFFAVVTGFSMDYLTPLQHRKQSFKEFMEEWIVDQFERTIAAAGLERPWYWNQFIESLDNYHHMVYASAYTYRATVWFDLALPGPEERDWLHEKYPKSWPLLDPIWEHISERLRKSGPGVEWYTHGLTPVTFCNLCQLVLSGGTPRSNTAQFVEHEGQKYVFCSEPCAWIFKKEPERYADHKDVVKRILAGEAPANLLELVRSYFGLERDAWGKDVRRGDYPWLARRPEAGATGSVETGGR